MIAKYEKKILQRTDECFGKHCINECVFKILCSMKRKPVHSDKSTGWEKVVNDMIFIIIIDI